MEGPAIDRGHLGTEVLMLVWTSEGEDEGTLSVRADENVLMGRKHFTKFRFFFFNYYSSIERRHSFMGFY